MGQLQDPTFLRRTASGKVPDSSGFTEKLWESGLSFFAFFLAPAITIRLSFSREENPTDERSLLESLPRRKREWIGVRAAEEDADVILEEVLGFWGRKLEKLKEEEDKINR